MKLGKCLLCDKEVLSKKRGRRKYCEEHKAQQNRNNSLSHYHRSLETGKILEYRLRSAQNHKIKYEKDIVYRLLTRTRSRAKELNIEFNLSEEDIILPEVCPVFNTPFVYKTDKTISVDRIDPSKGYIKGNIQLISWKANTMKSSASREELIMFANWILTQVQKEPDVHEVR